MKIHVVLVRSEYAGNVAACARAMANMGADRLILIDPKCRITGRGKEMAAGAQAQLKARIVYKTWEDFYKHEGDGLRFAFTRRGGRNRKLFAAEDKFKEVAKLKGARRPQNLYLIFGPEADGLNHEDMAFANFWVHLPVYGEFGSMNLAQAVLLSLFLARQSFPPEKPAARIKAASDNETDTVAPFYFPDKLIRDWLTSMGFNIEARKSSAYLTLKRMFLQNMPTKHEIQVLEAILHQNVRKLRELKDD